MSYLSSDDVARCVLSTFSSLPKKCKPLERSPGSREWVPLSGVVLETGDKLRCVALGTGMKCLPSSKLAIAQGNVLHDCHAEVVAIRASNRFLIDECHRLLEDTEYTSEYIIEIHDRGSERPFAIREDVKIHMYCSEAPCGDASMELVMAMQEDATPWESPTLSTPETSLKGRGSFAELGIVRRKPARPDAPPTLSKSCSDKLAMYQCTSILGSLASLLISPENAYIASLTLPASQCHKEAVARAFTRQGRFSGLGDCSVGAWEHNYIFRPFKVQTTVLGFEWSRRSARDGEKLIPSNTTAVYTPDFTEILINGVLQGRKSGDPKGASKISRRRIWKAVSRFSARSPEGEGSPADAPTYEALKSCDELQALRKVKNDVIVSALRGWIRNEGDEQWGLD